MKQFESCEIGTRGLPDGIFSNRKYQFGKILEGLRMENVGIVYGRTEYFTAIWYILRQFGIFYGNLVYFTAIWYILRQFGIFYGNLVYFMAIWYILRQFGIFYGNLVYFTAIWYFGILCQEKSGNPELHIGKFKLSQMVTKFYRHHQGSML
jgi:hypothetical protein